VRMAKLHGNFSCRICSDDTPQCAHQEVALKSRKHSFHMEAILSTHVIVRVSFGYVIVHLQDVLVGTKTRCGALPCGFTS
jgi:hypothetical protein